METTIGSPLLWGGFVAFVLVMLGLDLGVFHRKAHSIGFKEAAIWTVVWISLSMLFAGGVWWRFGSTAALEFTTGYLIEKSLSVDNIFVFVVVFQALRIPGKHQHRVLFWGILTALVLRAAMIFAGVALLERFHWLMYVFGAFLVVTGVRLFLGWKHGDTEERVMAEGRGPLKLIRRIFPATDQLHGPHFFTVENGKRLVTPLFTALVLVELSDVLFALDSIPAIFAVTRDPFIVFTSNIFAILGLRSLFFLLAGMIERFSYLKVGLSAVLVFVGAKMLTERWVHVGPATSLGVIVLLLGSSVVISLALSKRKARREGEAT